MVVSRTSRPAKTRLSTRLLILLSFFSHSASARDLAIKNNCDYTVWPAIADAERSPDKFTGNKGWEAKSKSEGKVSVGSNWWGNVWARRDCDFDTTGAGACVTGESGGGIQGGMFPMTGYAEFYFNGKMDDQYSLVFFDGFTVPMSLEASVSSCKSIECAVDINAKCPDDKLKQLNKDKVVVGCTSACVAEDTTNDSRNCCTGEYHTEKACLSGGVDFYSVFKPLCEDSVWFYFDNQNGEENLCPSSENSAYTVTFCPGGSSSSSEEKPDAAKSLENWIAGLATEKTAQGTDGKTTEGGSTTTTSNPEATGGGESTTTSAITSTSTASGDRTDATATATGTPGSSSTSSSSQSPNSPTSAPSSSNSNDSGPSSSASNEGLIFGYPQNTVFMVIGGAIAVVAVIGVILCVCMKQGSGKGSSTRSRSLPKGKGRDRYEEEDVFYYSSESSEEDDSEEEEESERKKLRS
ncbi:hypothetical protein JCM3765_004954 [Sporobolomyces pararoseus]